MNWPRNKISHTIGLPYLWGFGSMIYCGYLKLWIHEPIDPILQIWGFYCIWKYLMFFCLKSSIVIRMLYCYSAVTSNTLNILLLNTVLKYGLEFLLMRLHNGTFPALVTSSRSQISAMLQPGLKETYKMLSVNEDIVFGWLKQEQNWSNSYPEIS